MLAVRRDAEPVLAEQGCVPGQPQDTLLARAAVAAAEVAAAVAMPGGPERNKAETQLSDVNPHAGQH